MKKKGILFLLSFALMFSIFPLNGFSMTQNTDSTSDPNLEKTLEEIQKAIDKVELEIDINNDSQKKVEEVIYNDEGQKLGVLGIEEIDNPFEITPLADTFPINKGQTKTFKVFWYAATVNYHFYTKVKRNSNGLGEIVSAYDENYFVIPPGVVKKDVLSILRKKETSSAAAEVRYTLEMSAPVSAKLYINGRLKNGTFKTHGN